MTHTYSEGVIGLFLLLLLFFVPTTDFFSFGSIAINRRDDYDDGRSSPADRALERFLHVTITGGTGWICTRLYIYIYIPTHRYARATYAHMSSGLYSCCI